MKDMDFDKIFDDLLQLIGGLLVGIFHTGYEFIKYPGNFSDATLRATRGLLGPLTYFVCVALLFGSEILIMERMGKSIGVRFPSTGSRDQFIKILTKFDSKEILKFTGPLILVMAAYSALVNVASRILGSNISFRSAFATGCYFLGTVYLLMAVFGLAFVVAFPVFRSKLSELNERLESRGVGERLPESWREFNRNMLLFAMPLWLPGWLLIFKATHSYFVLLKAVSGTSYWRVLGACFGGTVLAVVMGLLCMGWFWAAFPDVIEKKFEENRKSQREQLTGSPTEFNGAPSIED